MRCVALLRAINLAGSRKLVMDDLRTVATDLGLEGAQTLLQSGNLVFSTRTEPAAVEAQLEDALRAVGLDTDVMVRTATRWREVIDANPFASEAERTPSRLQVFACKAPVDLDAVRGVKKERLQANGTELFVLYPDGIGDSKLKLPVPGTGRNWNTVQRIAQALER